MRFNLLILFIFSLLFIINCGGEKEKPIFNKLDPRQTGIHFTNEITISDSMNAQTDVFIYNGAGVAVGDINNDGLPDIFFSGNMVSSRLYLNKGNMEFEDITEAAGVETSRWATGVSMVDINNDGYLDIYVSVAGSPWLDPEDRSNMLFINNGDFSGDGQVPTFTEAAAEFNINDTGFTTHAVFFDYDLDGHLDLFLLSNSPEEFARGETGSRPGRMQNVNPASFDQLYRNNGDGTFSNVSEEAGIVRKLGYGLGVVVTDLNGDGWPDIYVSNDITPNDVLYINNQDGTFSDKAADWLRHTSFAGMGIDIADFTNNGWPDILQTDMMPEDLPDRKRMSGSTTYSGFMELRRSGYFPHYNVNTLQLNNGVDDNGNVIFSEIARLAGVAYTNWSWSALFADYDNDGFKDIFISNGYPKAMNDFDYLSDMHNARRAGNQEEVRQKEREILEELHGYEVSNYIFRNDGTTAGKGPGLTFTDKTDAWGMEHPAYSYGAAYADLNNNGRLDMVINNIDAPAFVYENTGPEETHSHYLKIKLNGESPNTGGIGSKLILTAGDQKQHIYHTPYRGFMSTIDSRVHFGLGEISQVDTLQVIWPDGRSQILTGLETDQLVTVYQVDASGKETKPDTQPASLKMFRQDENLIDYKHEDNYYTDYTVQSLLPYMVSKIGPPIAVADVTGNGLDDVFIGGTAEQPGQLFLQQEDGRFIEPEQNQPWRADEAQEDWDATFLDANGDGLPDLYVASGGYQNSPASRLLQDRLYINHGEGRFLKDTDALPEMLTSTATVRAGDFTGDGQPDLFVGGRLSPRNYPHPVRSYLLRNDGGRFTDITAEVTPELIEPGGMITDALWVDFNGDGQEDLVTAGEWMPVLFYENDGSRLINISEQLDLPDLNGWWFSLSAGDFNNDGNIDIVAGNLGLNHSYTTNSEESKFGVYAIDAGGGESPYVILSKEIDGTEYPFDGLPRLARRIFEVETRFTSFESYSEAALNQVFSSTTLDNSLHYQADTFASIHLRNNGDGTFSASPLPNLAQISPIHSILSEDIDGDRNTDILLAGNLYHTEPNVPRVDAGNGLWMKGDGTGNLVPVPFNQSGFLAPGDVRDLELIRTPDGLKVLVANNTDSLQVFSVGERE